WPAETSVSASPSLARSAVAVTTRPRSRSATIPGGSSFASTAAGAARTPRTRRRG
ncbi:MAG: LSU ribosomal protein L33p @ LSU ribosomal protein L33p, zinc-dependent, partial [uncultured Solirubrobacterales bacterium]